MSHSEINEIHELGADILRAALDGPYLPEEYAPNLACWVGAETLAWHVVMFFKRGTQDRAWFCHADIEWQQTFLMIVAIELLHTTEPGEES